MPPTTTAFGRRSAAAVAPARPPAPRPQPPPRPATTRPAAARPDDALSPAAEAFRAELAADRGQQRDAFGDWRRSQSWERWLMLGVRIFAFAPGIVTFFMDAPLEVTTGLEIAAFVGNIWFRMTRSRRMREVVAWKDPHERE